ncbi:MAG: hypothetical protein EXR50_02775 [Dehalococcoidia bacterium]|nr:hypothetical protein [Dehalococcoidia bacterium]
MRGTREAIATDQEIRAAYTSYIAYFGRYEVDDEKKTVTHHVAGNLNPTTIGLAQVRGFELSGNRITLRTPAQNALVWERVS